jgi:hypothetical protein
VPLLLAPIWLLYGYLYPILDAYFSDKAIAYANQTSRCASAQLPIAVSPGTRSLI